MLYCFDMIRLLSGTITDSQARTITLMTDSGIGYIIYVPSRSVYQNSEKITLHTHLAVRENALDLYGFKSTAELQWFELLLSVPKIGPKSALVILDQATPELLAECISQNDAGRLAKLGGIGKKTAEKIVQELAEKVPPELAATDTPTHTPHYQDAFDTLITLGYNPNDIRPILDELSGDSTSTLVTQALKRL